MIIFTWSVIITVIAFIKIYLICNGDNDNALKDFQQLEQSFFCIS